MTDTLHIFLTSVGFSVSLAVAFLFFRNRKGMLSSLVIALMIDIALCFVKDIFVTEIVYQLSWLIDMTAIPLYASILYELCMPGNLHMRQVILLEIPFVLLIGVWCVWPIPIIYFIGLWFAVAFGVVMAVWTFFAIPRYNDFLRATFSYTEDIDLRWLQYLLWTFFTILSVWTMSCVWNSKWLDIAYVLTSMLLWGIACRFIYRHKSVVDELKLAQPTGRADMMHPKEKLFEKIGNLILNDKLYLNPMLALSDIARMAGTNRTYASAYFNSIGETFYNHINRLRIEYAKSLLVGTDKKIDDIAAESGFNSRRSFHRAFVAYEGMTPIDYRIRS